MRLQRAHRGEHQGICSRGIVQRLSKRLTIGLFCMTGIEVIPVLDGKLVPASAFAAAAPASAAESVGADGDAGNRGESGGQPGYWIVVDAQPQTATDP